MSQKSVPSSSSSSSTSPSQTSSGSKTSAKVIEKQQQNASKVEKIASKLLDSINVNEMNKIIGIESNLALLMTMSSGIHEPKTGKVAHDHIEVENFEFLEFEIEIDDKCVQSVANSMDGLGYESTSGFEDDFIELITSNNTKMQIYPTNEKDDISNLLSSLTLQRDSGNDSDKDLTTSSATDANDTENKTSSPVTVIDDSHDSEIPFGNQIELSIMTGDSSKQMDTYGIVRSLTAYPYEKPIQRIFEIFESVYCLSSGVKRRCFMCLRMTASYSVISCAVAKIFRSTQSNNDRYVCRRCYESAKLFLINAEKQILANEPLADIECAQIDYKNCSNKFLFETEVPPSVNIGKLDVDFKSYRYQVERDYPILRQQMHYYKRYMIESVMPLLRLRLKQFKRYTNPNIVVIGRYLEAVMSLFDLIDDGLANALTMFRCVRDTQKQLEAVAAAAEAATAAAIKPDRKPDDPITIEDDDDCANDQSKPSNAVEKPAADDLLSQISLRYFWPRKRKLPATELVAGQLCLAQTSFQRSRQSTAPGIVWKRARVVQVYPKSQKAQIIWLESPKKRIRTLRFKSTMEVKHFRQIAYNEPYAAQLQVGERVVSDFYSGRRRLKGDVEATNKPEKDETVEDDGDGDGDGAVMTTTTMEENGSGDENEDHCYYYGGHILETLSDLNKNRYLIMFDNGDVRYVHHYFVRKTLLTDFKSRSECTHQIYLDVYYQLYPKKKSMHVSSRKLFYVEHGGEWEKAKIIYYDCSMAFIEHLNCHRLEWIALTSHRITTNEKMPITETGYRRGIIESGVAYRQSLPQRCYLDEVYRMVTENVDGDGAVVGVGDGKSGGGGGAASTADSQTDGTESGAAGLKRKLHGDSSSASGHEEKRLTLSVKLAKLVAQSSSIVKAAENGSSAVAKPSPSQKLRVLTALPLPFEVCSKRLDANCACIEAIKTISKNELKVYNPLRQPDEYGWKRIEIKKSHSLSSKTDTITANTNGAKMTEVVDAAGGADAGTGAGLDNDTATTDPDIIIEEFVKSFIFYKTPCGKMIGDIRILYQHLLDTNSPLMIENFSFDRDVKSDRELVESASQILIKNDDLSFGKENIPVSVVNSLNYQCPTDFTYLTGRQPSANIELNLSGDFVVCCDCVDDCSDWTKCSCRKLTVDEAQITIKSMDSDERIQNSEIGYQFMRLRKSMKCAIYECNEWCRCSKRCLNRVAQFPLRQSLQLYMTEKRGWGLRALHDIPKGTFICRYGGIIMTDDEANNDGLIFGDEYFADLDYIEVVESIKEGYEESVVDTDETSSQNTPTEDDNENPDSDNSMGTRRKSKRKCVLKKNHAKRQKKSTNGSSETGTKSTKKHEKKNEKPSQTRELYKDGNTEMFIMDAKSSGNIGRYFNHSCEPNLFVQNVFIETHDIRFPWVCFFSSRLICAGEELTWDYNYTPGSVPGRQIICMCGTKSCRGRLL